MRTIATRMYGASEITASTAVRAQIRRLQDEGYGALSGLRRQDTVLVLHRSEAARRAVRHVVDIREVRLAAGAGSS